ncbi:MAG: anthranilate synthase component I family protein [Fidelibacterota bacterium]
MIHFTDISERLIEGRRDIAYRAVHDIFSRLYRHHTYKFLFESKDVSAAYGRLSLIGIDPILKLTGKDDTFRIEVLDRRGQIYLDRLSSDDLAICTSLERKETVLTGIIPVERKLTEETERSRRNNIARIIRLLIQNNKIEERTFLGLYGAFGYDFIRLFEDFPEHLPANDIPDFQLFLYDTFIYFDHLKERAEIITYREKVNAIQEAVSTIETALNRKTIPEATHTVTNASFALSPDEYTNLVHIAREYARKGELFEVVFANKLTADFQGDPYSLYLRYRDLNPSPYLFYQDFGSDSLVGASPEMMVRVENNTVHLRPISGTIPRGQDPVEDHENMLELLSHPKERAELDMLIDLGRNDLSRICQPGLKIQDYRFVEKYSRVMHTVAHLSGELKPGYTALDALISCVNAGTLTGAPKVAAMTAIEQHETERRGYYGGSIGYLTFSGDMDTSIIIRTAHIRKNTLTFQAGATLLYDSVPEKEYQETIHKAQAFLDVINAS